MDRGEQHIIAWVEDRLGAVTVVVVDVKDRHLSAPLVEEGLGGDGGVVQVAVTTHQLTGRMVARWPTQGEGAVGAGGDGRLGAECDLGGAIGGLPGAGGNRRAGIEAVVAELAVQAAR